MHRNADRKGTTSPIAVQFASACQQYLLKYICVCAEADCEYIRCKPTDPRRMILCLLKTNKYTYQITQNSLCMFGSCTVAMEHACLHSLDRFTKICILWQESAICDVSVFLQRTHAGSASEWAACTALARAKYGFVLCGMHTRCWNFACHRHF